MCNKAGELGSGLFSSRFNTSHLAIGVVAHRPAAWRACIAIELDHHHHHLEASWFLERRQTWIYHDTSADRPEAAAYLLEHWLSSNIVPWNNHSSRFDWASSFDSLGLYMLIPLGLIPLGLISFHIVTHFACNIVCTNNTSEVRLAMVQTGWGRI